MDSVPFSQEVRAVYQEGRNLAMRTGMPNDTSHILLALFMVPSQAQALLLRTGLEPAMIVDGVNELPKDKPDQIDAVYNLAMDLARRLNSDQVTTVHLLVALTRARNTRAYKLLQASDVSIHVLRTEALASLTEPEMAQALARVGMETGEFSTPEEAVDTDDDIEEIDEPEDSVIQSRTQEKPPESHGPYDMDPDEFPVLSRLGTNLMKEALNNRLDPVIGRDQEILQLIDVLNKRRSNNPLLLGEPGVGKTALVEGLARRVVERDPATRSLWDRVIIAININDIIAGTAIAGSLAQRLSDLRREMAKAARRVIVFFDEIHLILSAGLAEGSTGLANDLKGALARGEFTCIGATTFHEYARTIQGDPALNRRFEVIKVAEPTIEQAEDIVRRMAVAYGNFHRVTFDTEALQWAVRMAVRFMPKRSLPDKALNLIDVAGAHVSGTGKTEVTVQDIVDSVASITGLSPRLVSPDAAERFSGFEQELLREMPGARDAIVRLSGAIRRNHTVRFTNSPLGVFGVHAEVHEDVNILAHNLARLLFGAPENVVRIDLSEYTEGHSVSSLIGSPPGYVGHEQPGMLARAATRTPFAVYVWRAVDLTDRNVLRLIEQILKDGIITDRQGSRLHYANTLHLLLLSDGAYEPARKTTGFVDSGADRQDDATRQAFHRVLPAGILNTIDEYIDLPVPGLAQLEDLVRRHLDAATQEAERSYGINMRFAPDLVTRLARDMQGQDYRDALERIRNKVLQGLAKLMLDGKMEKEFMLYIGGEEELIVAPVQNSDSTID